MKIIKQPCKNDFLIGSVVAIGNFDGVHVGHQKILTTLRDISQKLNIPSVVIIFNPHPRVFFSEYHKVFPITSFTTQALLIKKHTVEYIYHLDFDYKICNLCATQFVKNILLDKLNMKTLVVGRDFCFGKNRAGNIQVLKQLSSYLGFDMILIDDVCVHGEKVSSSLVRKYLQCGKITKAKRLLGSCYQIAGVVTQGHKRSNVINTPTANIDLKEALVPIKGVFAVTVEGLDRKYYGVANIGCHALTLGVTKSLLEVHIIDFCQNIYGKYLTINFEYKIRDGIKLTDTDKLQQQIYDDIVVVKDFFDI